MPNIKLLLVTMIVGFSGILNAVQYESRAIIQNIEYTQNTLLERGAQFKGEYSFTDYIYKPADRSIDLNKEFIRLRVYQNTNWNQKKFVISHKIKEIPGCSGRTVYFCECDSLEEAEQILSEKETQFMFSFSRLGYEYSLQGMRIFVEDIQKLPPTIEIIASCADDINYLFNELHAECVAQSVSCLVVNS